MRYSPPPSAIGLRLTPVLPALALALAIVLSACGGEKFEGEPAGRIAFTTERDGNYNIYTMEPDGSDPVRLTDDEAGDMEPAWSPDGERIAFSSFRTGPANLFAVNADGSDVQQLTEDPGVEGGVRWSPDGKRIAFYSFRVQAAGLLWVMDLDGGDPQPLLAGLEPNPQTSCAGGFPGGWFADGERILFRGSQGGIGALQICSIAADGSGLEVILSEEGVESYFPSLSPDGTKIAFTSDRDEGREDPDIYVMDVDGRNIKRLTNDPAIDEYPSWSPDGQWIAFHSNRGGDFEIFIMRPDGSDVRQLTDNDIGDLEPAWSPSAHTP